MTTEAAPTYGSYLHVDELLALQCERSTPAHHDELLFIIIHQVYELWFKQLLHEIEAAMPAVVVLSHAYYQSGALVDVPD